MVVAMLSVVPSAAAWWGDPLDDYVASLAEEASPHAALLVSVKRPRMIVNRLDVVFVPTATPEQRGKALHEIAQGLLRVTWRRYDIRTVTVREVAADGTLLDAVTTSMTAGSTNTPMSMGAHGD